MAGASSEMKEEMQALRSRVEVLEQVSSRQRAQTETQALVLQPFFDVLVIHSQKIWLQRVIAQLFTSRIFALRRLYF